MTLSLQHCLLNIFYYLCILLLTYGNDSPDPSKGSLPFCGIAESSSRYIFVSTLDGKLTALNPNDEGSVLWSIHPGSESMLSSSIHKLELSNYGHLVRMIPSLSGGLYKFNGENIEVIPVTADNLLQSSFRYSNDLVISGGKETRTFGVSLRSGNIIYECSMKGCGNVSQSTDGGEILVIQRLGQIVRAVEPRTGTEKWNFSVAQHDLKLLSECHPVQKNDLNYKLKVIVPDGMIYAVDSNDESKILWKHKFSSPVVNAWQLFRGELIEVDLFNGYPSSSLNPSISPSIYVGMHNKQLYIQESVLMQKKREEIASKIKQKLIGTERNYPRIPWKPIPASSTALDVIHQQPTDSDEASQRQTTALSVLYASPYVNGNGFYLYSDEELEKMKGSCNKSSENFNEIEDNSENYLEAQEDFISGFANDFSEANTSVEIVIVSFWYYWKEVLVISITTAFLCNIMITRLYLRWKVKHLSKISENDKVSPIVENDSGVDVTNQFSKVVDLSQGQEYTSRYLTDFYPVACLGKGGFGVVFEAKNKIDECHYAIKRILLPSRKESRDRVMREVKALAKLDHHHIVRYFNAWTECPPPGWQENYDKSWTDANSDLLSSNDMTSVQSTNVISETNSTSSFRFNTESTNFPPSRIENIKGNSRDISDSFIVFDGSGQENSEKSFTRVKENSRLESIVTFSSEKEESEVHLAEVVTKSDRPSFLMLDQKASFESQCLNKVYLYIQMQLCQRQSLRDWLINNTKRDYETILNIFEQILQAVQHVHLHGLIHRDLKPSNIFFSLDNQIKVGDFGLVTAMTEGEAQNSPVENIPVSLQNIRHTAQVGTQLYMSREQLLGKPYSYKVDIYSLGLILFELLVPFSTQMERIQVLQDIKNENFPKFFIEKYKKEHELLKLMLSHSPDERPTTYGVRARLPLKQEPVDENWYFELPTRKRTFSKTSRTSVSSNEGSSESK